MGILGGVVSLAVWCISTLAYLSMDGVMKMAEIGNGLSTRNETTNGC
jgi:hypothetical protein